MTRATSENGIEALELEEGKVRRTYLDVRGIPTKGVGHTNAAGPPFVKLGDGDWTEAEIDAVLKNDLRQTFEPTVDEYLTPKAPQSAFDGAVSFHFNTGAVAKATWVSRYNHGDPTWKDKFREWNRGGGRVIAGLTSRREREIAMIEAGVYRGRPIVLDATTASGRISDVRQLQTDLAMLGFYHGEINGAWTKDVEAAVRNFQAKHPHLLVDGRVGTATQAQIARAKALAQGGGGAIGGLGGASIGAFSGAPLWFVIAFLAITLVLLAYLSVKYWPEIQQRWNKWRNKNVP